LKNKAAETFLVNRKNKISSEPLIEPLVLSTTFYRDENGEFIEGADIYSRATNPNRKSLEVKLALLENAAGALAFSSGQAATSAVFMSLKAGDHVLIPDDIYYGTRVVLEKVFSGLGLSYTVVDMTDLKGLNTHIQTHTRLIWIESPSNPSLKITDIKAVVELAKNKGIQTVCDNTWATPYHTLPLDMGVDLVMHSATKYFSGHSDILAGAIMWSKNLNEEKVQKLKDIQALGGGVLAPFDCWLLNRSLGTFTLRMARQAENAMLLAKYLEEHPAVDAIYYPGLASFKYKHIADTQMVNGYGAMLSVIFKCSETETKKIGSKLKIAHNATSLGGIETLVDHRYSAEGIHSSSHPSLMRISVGIENIDDLIADFKQAIG
jgi:cystathionine gamma-synthase